MSSARWYYNRFKTMSAAEMLHRLCKSSTSIMQRIRRPRIIRSFMELVPTSLLFPVTDQYDIPEFPPEINIFGIPFNYSKPTDWHLDLSSSRSYPLTYSRDIDIRTDQHGNAKMVWEVNRMLFLPWICINYRLTGKTGYLEIFKEKITSWSEQNPYLTGVNWYSNIEINIRLINWVICWEILEVDQLAESNASFKAFILDNWLPEIYRHCRHSYANPSLYSSANNHLIAEYSGLFLASMKWKFNESERWLKYAKKGLENEIRRQHSIRGINKEEAAEYIQFITDFLLIPYAAALNTRYAFSKEFEIRIKSILDYVNAFLDRRFSFPKYGDEDDGKVVMLSPDPSFNNFRSLLVSGAILFNDAGFLAGISNTDLKNKILFGERANSNLKKLMPHSLHARQANVHLFADDGHHIIKDEVHSGKELYIHFDAAPLGYLSIAAHGHADALSFIVHLDGQPIFIDSGTYTYHTEPLFRKYFMGTLAHNTVRINECDQAKIGGPTLWTEHFSILQKEASDDGRLIRLAAAHDGYAGQYVLHHREFIYDKASKCILITDTITLSRKTETLVEIPFHLHPDLKINEGPGDHEYILQGQDQAVTVSVDEKLDYELHSGEVLPVLGWYSESFGKKRAAPVLYGKTAIHETSQFKTRIVF